MVLHGKDTITLWQTFDFTAHSTTLKRQNSTELGGEAAEKLNGQT